MILGGTSPEPRVGSPVELSCSDASGLLDLVGVGKTLSSQGITAEEPPPALLQIEPARSCRNEDVLEAWMLSHPGSGLGAVIADQIISDHEDVACRIVGFDSGKQRDVVGRVARGGTSGELLAIAHA